MRPLGDILLRALRHTLAGVAVLAVLSMALRLHPHDLETADHSPIAAAWSADGQPPADPGQPDPDGGDACDCPCQTVHPPQRTTFDPTSGGSRLVRMLRRDVAPDHISYPPDPPPARLS